MDLSGPKINFTDWVIWSVKKKAWKLGNNNNNKLPNEWMELFKSLSK